MEDVKDVLVGRRRRGASTTNMAKKTGKKLLLLLGHTARHCQGRTEKIHSGLNVRVCIQWWEREKDRENSKARQRKKTKVPEVSWQGNGRATSSLFLAHVYSHSKYHVVYPCATHYTFQHPPFVPFAALCIGPTRY